MIADRHVHTGFSEDSSEDPKKSIEKAISLGMRDLYITDHYDMDFPDGLFMFDPDEYFRVMNGLKEAYKDQIQLHIGVELGLKTGIASKLKEFIDKWPFEFVIGSIHLIDDMDPYERELFDMDDAKFYKRYFDTALEALRECRDVPIDTFGHLDYVVRYGYERDKVYSYEKYSDVIDEILKEIISRNIALEVNTAGIRKGLKFAHPYPDVLKRYRQLGGKKLTIGSDAHIAEDIGSDFDVICSCLKKLSFSDINFI